MARPVGASFSDSISVPPHGGLGLGKGLVSFILTVIIVVLVGYLSVSHKDVMHEVTVSE